MATETEVKVRIEDVEEFCGRLLSLGAVCMSERSFEDNILLDFPDGRLRARRCILRIRTVGGKGVLTYKGAPQMEGIFKSREELETEVRDPETTLEIVEHIGMRQGFRYQKYRREFALDGVHVAVDETPVGDYTELEGTEDGILALAGRLGFAPEQFIRDSYHALYVQYCQERGTPPQQMVFRQTETETDNR